MKIIISYIDLFFKIILLQKMLSFRWVGKSKVNNPRRIQALKVQQHILQLLKKCFQTKI